MTVFCPHCGWKQEVGAECPGQSRHCAQCGGTFTVQPIPPLAPVSYFLLGLSLVLIMLMVVCVRWFAASDAGRAPLGRAERPTAPAAVRSRMAPLVLPAEKPEPAVQELSSIPAKILKPVPARIEPSSVAEPKVEKIPEPPAVAEPAKTGPSEQVLSRDGWQIRDFQKIKLHYKAPVAAEEAGKIGVFLAGCRFLSDAESTVILDKPEEIYEVGITLNVPEKIRKYSDYYFYLKGIGVHLSAAFLENRPVRIALLDRHFNKKNLISLTAKDYQLAGAYRDYSAYLDNICGKIAAAEKEVLESESRFDQNLKEKELDFLIRELRNEVLVSYLKLRKIVAVTRPATVELRKIHQLYGDAVEFKLTSCRLVYQALELTRAPDYSQIEFNDLYRKAVEERQKADETFVEWDKNFKEFMKTSFPQ